MRVGILRLDSGNYGSLRAAMGRLGADTEFWASGDDVRPVDWVVFPGVGALADVPAALSHRGLLRPLQDLKAGDVPFLGICLGLQMFFETGEEGGRGLGWLKGTVPVLDVPILPHIGFNHVQSTHRGPAWINEFDGVPFYFVHSFYVRPTDASSVTAITTYYQSFPSIVAAPPLYGVQFHPELSGTQGERFLARLLASHSV